MSYYAVPKINEDMFSSGTVNTLNSVASLPFGFFGAAITYNIRVRNLLNAFNDAKEYVLFQTEEEALNYLETHQVFSGTRIGHCEAAPLFKVEVSIDLDFSNKNEFCYANKDDLEPLQGKLTQLSRSSKINEDFVNLKTNLDEVAHSARLVWE